MTVVGVGVPVLCSVSGHRYTCELVTRVNVILRTIAAVSPAGLFASNQLTTSVGVEPSLRRRLQIVCPASSASLADSV